jgi:hypothetical protein
MSQILIAAKYQVQIPMKFLSRTYAYLHENIIDLNLRKLQNKPFYRSRLHKALRSQFIHYDL